MSDQRLSRNMAGSRRGYAGGKTNLYRSNFEGHVVSCGQYDGGSRSTPIKGRGTRRAGAVTISA